MISHIKVLFVEDIPSDFELAVRELNKGGFSFEHIRVETQTGFIKALNDFRPDVVISDYIMPSYNGLQALKDVREFDPFIPFILFTESVNEEVAVQCMKAGANDYVLKEYPARLPYAVEEAIEKKAVKAAGVKAVQALKISESYFRSLIEHLSDYLLLANSNGTIKFSSLSFNELIGYTSEEIIGESAFKFIYPGDVDYIKAELKAFLSNPEIIREVNIHAVNKNGKSVFLRGKAQNLLNNSLFNGILLNLQDITEYKLSEEALRASEEQYRRLVEGSPSSIAIHVNGKFIYVNSAGAKLIGAKSPQELIGKPVLDIVHPDYRTKVIDRLKSSYEWKESPIFEEKFLKLDGSVIDVEVVGIPFSYQGQSAVQVIARDITERKREEVELAESEKRYKALFDKSINAVFLVDGKTGQYLNANKAAEELTGRSVESLKKMTTKDVSKTGADGRLLEIRRITDNVNFGEIVYHRPDGSTRNALLSAVSIDENQVFGIALDITDRIQKEVALLKSEERYRVFINSTEDLVFLKDEHLKYIIVNKANAAFFNKSEIEILGKTDFELMPEEEAQRCQLTDKITLCSDTVNIHKEQVGDKVYESRKFKILLENASYGVGGYIRDITKEMKVQIALQKSEHLFNTLATISPVGIFHADTDCRTTYVNPALCQMAGISEETAIGNGWLSFIHPDDTELVVAKMKSSIQNQSGSGFEYRFLRPDGSIVNFIGNVSPEFDSDKHLVGFVGTLTDITELKKMEGNLIEAKEKAEESDRLKSAFLTNMSHEIRTPMNGILGFTELLKEPNLSSDDQQDFIQTIQISGARMLNTINSIVDISKIESGLMKVDIKGTNINEKIEFTYKFFKPEVEIKGLQFLVKSSLTSKEVIIETDGEKVYGVLTNLVKNAIKFTFEGSIEFGYEKNGEYLEFFVKDTGIGIPKNQTELIFERFRQGSESHTRGYEGSGLGLSIAKSYVEMLGGEIWVESKEGKGSTFYFTIPYNEVLEEKTEIENAISTEHKEVQLKNLKILIVEDDEISYSLLSRTLQKISKEVLHAKTGVEAIEFCHNNPDLDLVLMDIKMHDMDGHEATRQIRQFNKDVIIIAQTAFAFSGDKEMAIEAGCNDYITKPINSTSLFELIRKHMK